MLEPGALDTCSAAYILWYLTARVVAGPGGTVEPINKGVMYVFYLTGPDPASMLDPGRHTLDGDTGEGSINHWMFLSLKQCAQVLN